MHVRIIGVLLFLFSLTGCKPPLDIEASLAEVNAAIDTGKTEEARIELRNLLAEYPENLTARTLLGQLLAETGNFPAAKKELEYAIRLGATAPDLTLDLMTVYLRLAEYESVIETSVNKSELTDTQLSRFLVYKGIALSALNRIEESKSTFSEATEIGNELAFSRLSDAYLETLKKNNNEAIALLDELLKIQPGFTEALLLQGQLALTAGDFTTAETAFRQYVESLPDSNEAQLLLASTLIRAGKYSEARPIVLKLLQLARQHGYLNQLLSVIEFQERNYESAKRYGEVAVRSGLKTEVLQVVLGISNYQLGLYEQSYRNLKSVSKSLPSDHPALRLLILTQLHLGYTVEAHSTLADIEQLKSTDAELLTSLGILLNQDHQEEKAQDVLHKLASLRRSNPEILADLGMLKIELGDLTGVKDLEQAIENKDLSSSEVMTIVESYLVSQDYDGLRSLGSKLIDREEELAVLGYNAIGLAESRLGNVKAALESYESSLDIDPLNAAALMYKAQFELQEGNSEEAKKILIPLANQKPKYQEGVTLLFSVYATNDGLADGIQFLDHLVSNNPEVDDLKLTLAMSLLKYMPSQLRRVPELLNEIVDESTKHSDYYLTLSESQLRLGMLTEAEKTLLEWHRRESKNETATLALLGFYDSLSKTEKYSQILKDALLKYPELISIRALEVKRLVELESTSSAQFELNQLPKGFRNSVSGLGLQAHIDMTKNRCEQAIQPLLNYYELIPNKFNAKGVIRCLRDLNRQQELLSFMVQRVTDYPGDVYTRNLLANMVFYSDPELAMEQYEGVLQYDPKNLIAANNYAWLLFEAGNLNKAENVARSALTLDASVPAILDTLAHIIEHKGNSKEALDLMTRAYSFDNSPEIAIHYADLLIKNRNLEEAKRIIDEIKPANERQQAELQHLLAEVSSGS